MEQSNIDFNKIQKENIILSPNSVRKADNIQIIKDTLPHDEPGLYHGLGVFSFATATLLLGISYWDGFDNKILLTVYGFFIGGLGQLICGIMCFKERYYLDGKVYFYFIFNWTITACYDLFPIFGWMDPLSDREYGYHNLMGCLFTLIFFLQNLNTPSLLTRISFATTFISFVLSTIGSFAHSTGVVKAGGIFCMITASLAYYSSFGMTINERYQKVYIPLLDGKDFGQKLH